jgi:hypothetical protein
VELVSWLVMKDESRRISEKEIVANLEILP